MSDDQRPFISIDPAMKCGSPTLNHTRLPAESVARCVWDGWDLAKLQADGWSYLRRSDVLVCCWFLGRHGSRTWRKRWEPWAKAVQNRLWHASTADYEAAPWPPTWQPETPALPKRCVTCGDRLMATLPLTCFGCNQRAEGQG